MLKLLVLIWFPLTLLTPSCAHAQGAKRLALVIGNSDYALESKLANPVNDAQLIARTLKAQGFSVEVKIDLPKRAMELAIAAFVRQSAGAESAVLYYAGHGVQAANGGRNYLLPVDARVEGDDTLDTDGIAADRIVDQLERVANPARLRLVVLDACRNNRMAGKTRSGVRGLARMSPGDDYTLIAFSTNDQEVALDGGGTNSPYAKALSQYLAQAKELPLRRIFELTATEVRLSTNQKQRPRTYGDLDSRMLLDGTQMASAGPAPTARLATADPEDDAWQVSKAANTAEAYGAYLNEYPSGRHAGAARAARKLQAADAARQSVSTTPKIIKDCAGCPEMVALPAGDFLMGSDTGEAMEEPMHRVKLRAFAIGKFEITQGQWKAVMGSNPSAFNTCGAACPVESVSWDDVQKFIKKFNVKSGKQYRLPTEAEWEYACRGGRAHTHCGADKPDDVAVYAKNSGGKSERVGNKQSNAWGLFDMSGNVMEWVQDCGNSGYAGAPVDGSAWSAGNCDKRTLRGGSWEYEAAWSRSAFRMSLGSYTSHRSVGFRLALTLP
ncbi:MAG: SUMF1/EgtB/PvdO family nonheme iron enzyme [Pseudomonadota bacterium]